jgi:hypothetical protein
MQGLQYSSELLAPLTGLKGLTQLNVEPVDTSAEGLGVVCQLTGLRRLHMRVPSDLSLVACEAGEQLLQLTQLRKLTHLDYAGLMDNMP